MTNIHFNFFFELTTVLHKKRKENSPNIINKTNLSQPRRECNKTQINDKPIIKNWLTFSDEDYVMFSFEGDSAFDNIVNNNSRPLNPKVNVQGLRFIN